MVNIIYGNVNFKIEGLTNSSVINKIAEDLSYMTGGFGIKKERKYIFNAKNCMGYTGTLPYVIRILNRNHIKFTMTDKRVVPPSNAGYKLVDWVKLRDYQEIAVDNVSSRSIIQCATGGGKTCMMAAAIVKFNVKPVVVMSPKATLAYQLRDEIAKFTGEKVGVLCGLEQDIQDITVCTPQTALKHQSVLENSKAILFDECQFLGSRQLFNCARAAKNAYYRLAVSATPWRDGGDDILIEAAINVRNPRSNISATTLTGKGKLTGCDIYFIKETHDKHWLGDYGRTYNECIVHNTKRNNHIVELAVKNVKKNIGGVLVLFGRTEHGQILLNAIREKLGNTKESVIINGIKHTVNSVELIDGSTEMSKRNIILEAARQKKIKVLLGSTIADEGLDVPYLKVLILAGAGKSSTRAFQRVGRVLRLSEGYDRAIVYDFKDLHQTFFKQYMYRKALYQTEKAWANNMHEMDENNLI